MIRLLTLWLLAAWPAFAEVDLTGVHPVSSGDDPRWAILEFEDADWDAAAIPNTGKWEDNGGGSWDNVRWMRIPFTLKETIERPSLLLGMTSGGDQVFLNGVEIGETASILEPWIQMKSANWSRAWPRLYHFDGSLFRKGKNVLAIRFSRAVRNNAAVLSGPVVIGERGNLIERHQQINAVPSAISGLIITLYLVMQAIVIAALVLGFRNKKILAFSAVYTLPILGAVYLSPVLMSADLGLSPIFEVYAQRCRPIGTLALVSYVALVLGERIPIWLGMIQVGALALLLLFPYDDDGVLSATRDIRYLIVLAALFFVTAVSCYWAINALFVGQLIGLPLCLGYLGLFGGIGYEFVVDRNALLVSTGVGASDFGVTATLICLAIVAGMSIRQTQLKLAAAQTHALQAHESERRRIARDVHDGVGQWLSTIKMNLQVLRSRHNDSPAAEGIAKVVGHLDEAISDTRRIAHDLSPALIEKDGLAAALRSHADRLSDDSDVKIIVLADQADHLPHDTQGHLFRISQEALTNAIRHGKARNISIELTLEPRSKLTIEDDGTGFEASKVRRGLGISSIEERVTLIGGSLEISRRRSGGARLRVVF